MTAAGIDCALVPLYSTVLPVTVYAFDADVKLAVILMIPLD